MKKAIVTTRAVYHKTVSIEVSVPLEVEDDNVRDWLFDNEHLFIDELDDKLSNAKLEYGFGVTTDNGMVWKEEESETRYDVVDPDGKFTWGGHL